MRNSSDLLDRYGRALQFCDCGALIRTFAAPLAGIMPTTEITGTGSPCGDARAGAGGLAESEAEHLGPIW